jgi:hypothetical protein
MAGCKFPLHPRGKGAHELEEERTCLEGRKQEEEGGRARVLKGRIQDLQGHARISDGRAQGRRTTNRFDRGAYECMMGMHGLVRVYPGTSRVRTVA